MPDEKVLTDKEVELEKLRLEYAAASQQRRIQFWTMIFTAVMGIVTPLMVHVYHGETVKKVDEVKAEAAEASTQAAKAVKVAANEAGKLNDKVDAVSDKAAEVLAKVDNMPTAPGPASVLP
jgi:hypothetical protein